MAQRILVVDDDKEIVRLLRSYIEQSGCEVLVAYDGETALHILRRERPDLFALGAYRPLDTHGARKAHAVAFARTHGPASLVVVVGRLYAGLTAGGRRLPLGDAWEDTLVEVPRTVGELNDALTGERVLARRSNGRTVAHLGELFAHLPVAVLSAGV
jgi:maltooligosyltrehalose synthase